MAVEKFLKIRMYGVKSEQEDVLNALIETGVFSLKETPNLDHTTHAFNEKEYMAIEAKRDELEKRITAVEEKLYDKKIKVEGKPLDVTARDLQSFEEMVPQVNDLVSQIDDVLENLNVNKKEMLDLAEKIKLFGEYKAVENNFHKYKSTKNVLVKLGTFPEGNLKELDIILQNYPLATYEYTSGILALFAHKSNVGEIESKLVELSFTPPPFELKGSFEKILHEKNLELKALENKNRVLEKSLADFGDKLPLLKTGYDYYSMKLEKIGADNFIRSTRDSFVLEGFVPEKDKRIVEKALKDGEFYVEYEFSAPTRADNPPTLLKNNKVVSQFEFVTNMYSPPNYFELDPNIFITIFFSLFFGFVMADIGYGIFLVCFGLLLASKQKKNSGAYKLWNVIAFGGIFTMIFGFLFGSFFGLSNAEWSFIPRAVLPNPAEEVVTMLAVSLGFGVAQIMVGFFLKGIQLLRQKRTAEAIFSGFMWEGFFIGIVLVALDVLGVKSGLLLIGLIISGVSVLVSVVGLVVINRGFERLSKGFGALYSIINIFSDVLSYARLFGLMLSGAIIASIVNQLAGGFFNSIFTAIFGIIILAIGHGFNLAMGVLGAYIHVARLQYIEFFSRFYEGEGEVFVPFGSKVSYVNLTK